MPENVQMFSYDGTASFFSAEDNAEFERTLLSNKQGQWCTKCGLFHPITEFTKNSGKSHYRTECNSCIRELTKVRARLRRKNPPPNDPNYFCPICKRTADQLPVRYGLRQKQPWVLDHDHKTNEFRAYLCHQCNIGIGQLGDNPDNLRAGIDYLDSCSTNRSSWNGSEE